MHGATFDELLRGAFRASSRRGVVRAGFSALAASVLTTLGLRAVDNAAAKKKRKKKKKKCAKSGQAAKKKKRCCRGLSKDATGRCAPPCAVCASGCAFTSVQEAIDDAAPGATLTLCAGVFTGIIEIAKNLTLIGAGDGAGPGNTILDGAGAGTVVTIAEESTVTLQNLRITGASKSGVGGGIVNSGTVALTGCTVTGNRASQAGGIWTHGTATITDCAIFGNEAISSWGGGIENFRTLELTNSTVTGNTSSSSGGGIYNQSQGLVTLEASSVTGNRADGSAGGGIYNSGAVSCSSDSIVNDNKAGSPPVESNCSDAGGTGCATCPD